jgi:GTPase SAR1 family protein
MIEFICGPPGAGKTTYCKNMTTFLISTNIIPFTINLDPGNENQDFYRLNISSMVCAREIGSELHLGPNGSTLFSMEFFEKNIDWFEKKLKKFRKNFEKLYFLIDLPGQIEIFTHHTSIKKFIKRLGKYSTKITTIIVIDSFFLNDKTITYSILAICLSISLGLGTSTIILMSKADLFLKDFEKKEIDQKFIFKKFQTIFTFFSIFFWTNKFNISISETLFDFSSSLTIPADLFNFENLKKAHLQVRKINKN